MRSAAVAVALAGVLALGAVPASAQAVETVQYTEADGVGLLMDVYRPPPGRATGIGVVVIHGGRWMDGTRQETPADLLAAHGFVAFSVDYRLAPEHPYPAAIEDLQTAVRYIRDHAGEFGIDPGKLWAFGASSGGHLAALLGTLGTGSTPEDVRLAAVVSWSGPMDLERLARSSRGFEQVATQFVGCADVADPSCSQALREASPVTHLDPSDPPMFLANATAEPIPFDQAVVGAEAAEQAGVDTVVWPVEGSFHGFSYVREVLPPTIDFVLNEIEGQGNPLNPPTDATTIPTTPRETATEAGPGFQPRNRAGGGPLPFILGILSLVAAAVLGTVFVMRSRRGVG